MIATISDNAGFFAAGGDEVGDGLDELLRTRVKGELEPGERLLWAGQSMPPRPKIGVGYYIWLGIAILVLGVGVVFIWQAVTGPRPRFNNDDTPLGRGIISCIAGGALLSFTLLWRLGKHKEAALNAGSCYAVTDRRAIAWTPEPGTDAVRVHSWTKGRIGDVVRVERPDGSGSLEFTLPKETRYYWPPAGFQHIHEVRRVEQIVRHNLTTHDDVS